MNATSNGNASKLRNLGLTRLVHWLGRPDAILGCRVQNRLTALLLVLVKRIEGDLRRAGSPRGRRDASERH